MLKNKRLFLFDIDGTLAVDNTLFDGTRELLDYIRKIGGASCFITNNSTKSNMDYVKKFSKWEIDADEDCFVTAGFMTRQFLLREFCNEKIYVLGTRSFISELRQAGLYVAERPEPGIACAVAAYDSELTYEKMVFACEVLSDSGIPFYATNPDLCCPTSFGFIPDCGAICGMLACATGRSPVYLGKPNGEVVRLCLEKKGFKREETLVVGDRLYTDIACGINGGVDTCVLFTGEAKKEDLDGSEYRPDFCFDSVVGLLEALREGCGGGEPGKLKAEKVP